MRRLFVGNISKQLYATPDDLTVRLSKFGPLKSDFDLHYNEVRQAGYGYLELELTDKDLVMLKNSLHGVKYKGSNLVLDEAKPRFDQRWESDAARSNDNSLAKILKTEWKFFKKIDNVNKTYKDLREVVPGRVRKKPRKGQKLVAFRVNFNGSIKTIKCHKKKLWGYDKNRKLRDLVYKYQNSVWKDGNDHIVERVTQIKLVQGANELTIQRLPRDDVMLLEEFGDEGKEAVEAEKNNKVLASILGNFEFDKPLEYNDKLDDFGGSDFEYNNGGMDSDDEGLGLGEVDLSQIEFVKEGEFGKDIPKDVHYDEDDDDEMDIDQPVEEQHEEPGSLGEDSHEEVEAHDEEVEEEVEEEGETQEETQDEDEDEDEDEEDFEVEDETEPEAEAEDESEDEFIPTFGANREPTQPALIEGTVSNTETLRTLFNEDQTTAFNLIDDDDDIDHTVQPEKVEIELPQPIASIAPKIKQRKGLFFPHFESPFLVAQTQLNKLTSNIEFDDWDKTFWEKRSEWTSEFKRRKRDVLRQMRKKNAKNSRVLV